MSNAASSIRVRFEDLRSLAFGSISGTYTAVGTPFSNPVRILKVTNLTDANLLVSFNGIDDKDIVAANGFFLYDFSTNKSDAAGLLEQSAGDRLYIKDDGSAATSGSVYVTVVYASQV
jgi:hypothetical protein